MKYFFLFIFIVGFDLVSWSQFGCTDPLATNYSSLAVVNDGSCVYPFTAQAPDISLPISDVIMETSGLLFFNQQYWTHNDDTDPAWYAVDSVSGQVVDTLFWNGMQNIDWEDIQQNESYFFIGDVGNNSGNRTDLKILRIPKSAVSNFSLDVVDTISFHYDDQLDFNNAANDHDYDCEAFIVEGDSIFLFTKCWASHTTSLYSLSSLPGDHVAVKRSNWDVQGMITGAHRKENQDHMILVGYNELVQPFVVLLYDFPGTQFLSGNKRKISLAMPFHQMEAISSSDGYHYYLTNEQLIQGFTVPAQLHHWNASQYLQDSTVNVGNQEAKFQIQCYPNPVIESFTVSGLRSGSNVLWELYDANGKRWRNGQTAEGLLRCSMQALPAGNYFLRLSNGEVHVIELIHH